jgi:hypothetical protein
MSFSTVTERIPLKAKASSTPLAIDALGGQSVGPMRTFFRDAVLSASEFDGFVQNRPRGSFHGRAAPARRFDGFVQNGRCTPGQDWLCDASAKKSAKAKRVRR